MNPYSKIHLALIGSLVLASSAIGQIAITTAYGNGADTELSNDSTSGPNVAHGSATTMQQRNYDNTRQHIGYIRFDLSGVDTSLLGWATGATLTFDVTSANRTRTWSVFGVSDSAPNNNWSESTLTYNTASGFSSAALGYYTLNTADLYNGGTATTLPANSLGYALGALSVPTTATGETLTTTATAGTGSLTTVNLENFLKTDTDGLVSLFFLANSDSSLIGYTATKENTTAGIVFPTLNLPNATPLAVPEPATLAMLGLGGIAAFGANRRRKA